MRIVMTAGTAATASNVLFEAPDWVSPTAMFDALADQADSRGAAVTVPPRLGLNYGDGTPLRFGVKAGIGVVYAPPPVPSGLCLVVVAGPATGAVFSLPMGEYLVGQAGDIALPDASLAGQHLRLRVGVGDGIDVEDLGSPGGTLIEGLPLPGGPVAVRIGDSLAFGETVAQVRHVSVTPAAIAPGPPGWVDFVRPQRATGPFSAAPVSFPAMPPPVGGLKALFGARKRQAADYEQRRQVASARLADAVTAERRYLRQAVPDAANAYLAAVVPSQRLWERRPGDSDFLTLRVGTATLDSRVPVSGSREQVMAIDVPVTINLAVQPVVGLVGPVSTTCGLLSWLAIQLATWHAPADLEMSFLTLTDIPEWSWLSWLPHVRDDQFDDSPLARVATDEASVKACVRRLQQQIKIRQAQAASGAALRPHVVILPNYASVRALVAPIIREGPAVGIYAMCCATQPDDLPAGCAAVFQVPDGQSFQGVLTCQGGAPIVRVIGEPVSSQWCDTLARELAPLRDVGPEGHYWALPPARRLVELLGEDQVTDASLAHRWRGNARSATVVVGQTTGGTLAVDLERDGPHTLIAGPGQNQLVRTLLVSLGVANCPDEMSFVLVDYKDSGVFGDCVELPHATTVVTDLNSHLAMRALQSLEGELQRRAHQRDVYGKPLPRLVIAVGDVVALANELPDFVTGLLDIGRRGQFLGVHLVLATPRPVSQVSPIIASYANLHITTTVNQPGAEVAVGPSTPLPFQPAITNWCPPAASAAAVSIRPVGDLCLPVPRAPALISDSQPSDLGRLVEVCQQAAKLVGAVVLSPWLPELPAQIQLDALFERFPQSAKLVDAMAVPYGMADWPSQQSRGLAVFDLAARVNLAVVGGGRSGRSAVLRAIAMVIAQRVTPADVHLYALDAAGGALGPLAGLPHAGAVVSRDQGERMAALVWLLQCIIAERLQQATGPHRWPYIVFMLDGWDVFYQTYESRDGGMLVQGVAQIVRDGPAVGVMCVVTGDDTLSRGPLGALFPQQLLLGSGGPVGRGTNGLAETQVAFIAPPGQTPDTVLRQAVSSAAIRWQALPARLGPARVDEVPPVFNMSDLARLPVADEGANTLPVAVGGGTLSLQGLDAALHGSAWLVAGPRRSGRSSTLKTLALFALRKGWTVQAVTLRPSALSALVAAGGQVLDGNTADQEGFQQRLGQLATSRSLLLVDDIDQLPADGWLAGALSAHLEAIEGTGSVLAVAGTPSQLSGDGLVAAVKSRRSGVLLSPRTAADAQLFGLTLPWSWLGQAQPPGAGYLVRAGIGLRVQVVYPDAGEMDAVLEEVA